MYNVVCEVEPGTIASFGRLRQAIDFAEREAEDYFYCTGSSQYMVVKDGDWMTLCAVRYTDESGGAFIYPDDEDMDMQCARILAKEMERYA